MELPRYKVPTSISAKPARTASRARARGEGTGERREHPVERRGVRLLRVLVEAASAAPAFSGVDEGEGILGRRGLAGVAESVNDHLGDAVGSNDAGAGCSGDAPALDDDDAHLAGAVDAIGRRRVERKAHVSMTPLVDQDDAAVGPGHRRGIEAGLDHLLGGDHAGAPETGQQWDRIVMLSVPIRRAR